VLPGLLGIERLRSEDSVRRAFANQDEDALTLWIDTQTAKTYDALLEHDWALDLDATVKTLYGRQEEARVGYNPAKPGRPSHVYQVMVLAAAKLVLNVDVQPGNQTASAYIQPTLWGWLEARDRKQWPTFVRGDIAHGNERMMAGCEERRLPYLFKLRQSKGVAAAIARLAAGRSRANWRSAGQGWEAVESEFQLQGWTQPRRVVVLRRLSRERSKVEPSAGKQMSLPPELVLEHKGGADYEYAVLVTNWEERDLLAVAQAYRDRADSENMFDELKNQWGWTGFSTQDLKRSQLMARIVALIFNWWSLYTRIASGRKHAEAITTRPLFLAGIGRRVTSGRQHFLSLSSLHAKAKKLARLLAWMSHCLSVFRRGAEQLSLAARWRRILLWIFRHFLGSAKQLEAPAGLAQTFNCRI
jgi:hypothetical protein